MGGQIGTEATPPDYVVRVIDECGQPVAAFQLMLQTADRGLTLWETGANGRVTISGFQSTQYRELQAIDALVRADGYACTLARFAGPDRRTLLGGRAAITLRRGERTELRFRLPQGLRLPGDFVPEVYFANHRDAVRIMWDPENRRAIQGHMPDFNFFSVERSDAGRFVFRLARGSEPFYVAVHRPGVLQFFESGPFTSANVANGVLEIAIPKPASLNVRFDLALKASDTPLTRVRLTVARKIPLTHSYGNVTSHDGAPGREQLQVTDLAPGTYKAIVETLTTRAGQESPAATIRPGAYHDSREVTLSAGETRCLDFRYAPLDPNVFRGDSTARIHVVRYDGSPAAGCPVKVRYRDAHHGDLEVFSGQTSGSGEVEIKGVTDGKPEDRSLLAYRILVHEQVLGSFGFTKDKSNETFTFHLPPRVGDVVPDIDLVNVSTGIRSKLRDLRGKVICLELWATWCGPCQEAMQKLCQLAAENRDAWRDRVGIVPLSIDEEPQEVSRHVKKRAWDQFDHYWSGAEGATGPEAPAMRALVGQAVPEIVIVDRDGRILWRGNPAEKSQAKDVAARIKEALAR